VIGIIDLVGDGGFGLDVVDQIMPKAMLLR
jgi:hypothetical protein